MNNDEPLTRLSRGTMREGGGPADPPSICRGCRRLNEDCLCPARMRDIFILWHRLHRTRALMENRARALSDRLDSLEARLSNHRG